MRNVRKVDPRLERRPRNLSFSDLEFAALQRGAESEGRRLGGRMSVSQWIRLKLLDPTRSGPTPVPT